MKILTWILPWALAASTISPGEPAPDFSAKNQDGVEVSLKSLRGKAILLFFYPKDETPGCTKEACTLRDQYAKFKKQGAVVFGVSKQGEKSHQAFRAKHKLPFDLLVDDESKLAGLFGIESMPLIGIFKRQSVLIGKDGKLIKIYRDVDPDKHAEEVLKDLEAAH